MKFTFKNSRGEERLLANVEKEEDVWKIMQDFLKDHDFKSYYTVVNIHPHFREYDVGSHTEFFYLYTDEEVDNDEFNEWLLFDRQEVIKMILVKEKYPIKFIKTENKDRDLVLTHLLLNILFNNKDILEINNGYNAVEISSIDSLGEELNPVCAEYDDTFILIKFNPLKVCHNDWIKWYIKHNGGEKELKEKTKVLYEWWILKQKELIQNG